MLAEVLAGLHAKVVVLDPETTTVIRGVRLIDGLGGPPIPDATIEIRGTRIASITSSATDPRPSADIPSGADTQPSVHIIDGTGLTAVPGLIDLHVHLTGDHGTTAIERYSIDIWNSYRDLRAAWHAAQTLEAGFTTVRGLGHGRPSTYLALRRAVQEGLLLGPRILTAGWSISQTGGHGDPHFMPHELVRAFRPRSAFADGVDECRRLVRQNFGEGADCIKIYVTEGGIHGGRRPIPNFTVDEIRAMVDEAHVRGARVAAHAMSADGIRNAVLGGVDTIEHGGDFWDDTHVLDLMIERGTYLVPTLTVMELTCIGTRTGVPPANARVACHWLQRAREHLASAVERGLQVACGTDSQRWAGNNAREISLLASAGLSPMQALAAATRVAARALGLETDLGTIETGKVGELVLLTADPLEDITVIERKESIRWIIKSRDQLTH